MDLELVKAHRFDPVEQEYDFKRVILYALGLGYGDSPLDPSHLKFVYEDGLKVVPAICNVLAHPGFWVRQPRFKIAWEKILHGEQYFEVFRPFPTAGTVRAEYEILAVEDKGADKGANLHLVKQVYDAKTNELLATVRNLVIMRGDGGFGGFGEAPPPPEALPDAKPDIVYDIPTNPNIALIYRLSGDFNPIHADPEAAKRGGLDRPILHGLCTLGLATRALITTVANGDPDLLRSQSARFSRMVYPGETIRTEIFTGGKEIRYRCRAVERDVVVLDRGSAVIA